MSESNIYTAGLNNVGSYISSGVPWITGSAANTNSIGSGEELKIEFPYVTKRIHIQNTRGGSAAAGKRLRVHLVATGSGAVVSGLHYYEIANDSSLGATTLDLNVKVKEIYLSAPGTGTAYSLVAELTRIPAIRMFELTGSGVSE
tara:strand:- start:923 stop:1357 length:435 start_codon:yes stop_codon:yes gene_type:complete